MTFVLATFSKSLKKHWQLVSIFLLAVLVRTVKLENLPATFFVDEVLSGYLGRYLWVNAQDLYGNVRPWLYFNKFGDYYILLPMYLDGLSTFLFGVTRFATRFPTALLGALAVFPMYGISWHVFKKRAIALMSVLLLALMPWHIVLSRATTESIMELTLVLTIVWSLLCFTQEKKRWQFGFAIILSLLSYLVYHTARILIPLIWIGYVFSFAQSWLRQRFTLAVLLIACASFLVLTGYISRTDWGRGRFEQTSLFSQQSGVGIRMNEMTFNLGSNSVLMARIFHNKVIGFGREFINQYLSYFDPSYLWSADSWLKTRYAVPEMGPVYLALLLMFIAWIVPSTNSNAKLKPNVSALIWLFWILLIAPLPASLTVVESPNLRRSVLMLIPLVLLAAAGWYHSWFIRWKSLSVGLAISFLLIGEVILFGYYYTLQSDSYNSLYRSDGWPEVANYIISKPSDRTYYVMDSVDFPLYYLFAKQDFSPIYSTKFGYELRITQLDTVFPRSEKCAEDLDQKLIASDSSKLIIEPNHCVLDECRFQAIEQVQGVNALTKLRVVRALSLTEVPKSCPSIK